MSVIAFDGVTMAADKQMTNGNGIVQVTKVLLHVHKYTSEEKRYLIGVTGCAGDLDTFYQWWLTGHGNDIPYPHNFRFNGSAALVATKDYLYLYEAADRPEKLETRQHAIGSGRDFARTAMLLGKTASEAVGIASHFDAFCGMGVDMISL